MIVLKKGSTSDVKVKMTLDAGKPVYEIVYTKEDGVDDTAVNLNIYNAASLLHDLRNRKIKIPANFVIDMLRAALGNKNEA